MNDRIRLTILRGLLWVVCASHVILILGAVAFAGLPGRVGRAVELTPQVRHVVRMLGAFMLAVGLLAAFAALRPRGSRLVVIALAVLLLLRVAQRIIFAGEIRSAFGISTSHFWLQSFFFLTLALALLVLAPRGSAAGETAARRK